MVRFPKEGKCLGVHQDLINYLKTRPATYPKAGQIPIERATGIGWNNMFYWFLRNIDNSTKPVFSYEQLKNNFFKPKTIDLW